MVKKIFLISIVSIAFLVVAFFVIPHIIGKLLPQKVLLKAQYIEMDLPTLANESDLVVLGTVQKVLPTKEKEVKVVIGEKGAKEAEKRGEKNFYIAKDEKAADEIKRENTKVFTDKVVKVRKYIKGPQEQEQIIICEEGGKIGNKTWEVVDQTPLKAGDNVILFLKRGNGEYCIVGGPQGKYYIQGDMAVREDGEDRKNISELVNPIESVK